jgi:hypothetical protein
MAKTLIKRRHTELHPEKYATENGKIRNSILSHIYKCCDHKISYDDYIKYCDKLKHDLSLGYEPKYWHKKFPKYIKITKTNNDKYLVLTRLGRNLVKIVLLN